MWFGFYKSFTAICLESDLPHLWLQFLLTTHTKWSIICNFAWTKLFEAFNNSKCIPRNFKHSDLHIIGLRASFWSRTLHKLVIPFLQAHKKWCLIEMAFWRQNFFFSFFFSFSIISPLFKDLIFVSWELFFILNVHTFLTESISAFLHTYVPKNGIFKISQGIQYHCSGKRIKLMVEGT